MKPPLLIAGGSARAAAWSALRAGFRPICADYFADEDLRAVADVRPVENYPEDLPKVVASVPRDVPWMYGGGMENHLDEAAAISKDRRLLGIPAPQVARLRNLGGSAWQDFARAFSSETIAIPALRLASDPPERDGRWMLRPLRGAAGRGIAVWDADAEEPPSNGYVFQERAAGDPISCLCLGDGERTRVIGFALQWVGESVCHAKPFQYCGTIVPYAASEKLQRDAGWLATALATSFDLKGFFGCDFLFDGSTARLTEINPRYTASIEMFEFATSRALLAEHAACFGAAATLDESFRRSLPDGHAFAGKAILFAPEGVTVPTIPVMPFNGLLPELADIPRPGSRIPARCPVFTVMASGPSFADVEERLQRAVAERSIWLTET